MAFKSLHIKNFQAHKNTRLDFHPGVNIIRGPSHNGKSCIVRAFRWVLQNRPNGDEFRSHFAAPREETSVKLTTSAGAEISRKRERGTNTYEISHCVLPDGSRCHEVFRALRSDVPEEVSTITNVSEINLQSQFDKHFLISDPPGEVARKINDLLGLSIIYKSFRWITNKINTLTTTVQGNERLLASTTDQLTGYDWLDEADTQVQMCVDLKNTIQGMSDTFEVLKQAYTSITEQTGLLEELDYWLDIEHAPAHTQIKTLLTDIKQTVEMIQNWQVARGLIQSTIDKRARCDEDIALQPQCAEILGIITEIGQVQSEADSFTAIKQNIINYVAKLAVKEGELRQLEESYIRYMNEMHVCPLCNQVLRKHYAR